VRIQAGNLLLVYYRQKSKTWELLKHITNEMQSEEVANLAAINTVTNLGGASKPRRVEFGTNGIQWQNNPFWETEKDAEWAWALHRQPFWMTLAWAYQTVRQHSKFLVVLCSPALHSPISLQITKRALVCVRLGFC
jgi:hypothetical protein